MLNRIITWSLENRLLILVLTLLMMVTGWSALRRLPIDAFPDTTPVQVQINTVAPALSPLEVEGQITMVVEQALSGIPNLLEVRSISKFGLSQVTLLFEDRTDIYFARQQVMERLQSVELAEGIPQLGPVATGLGEVYHYLVTGQGKSLKELTTIHDWQVKPRLRSVPGVAEVNTWGGQRKQYHVIVDPDKLIEYQLELDDVLEALRQTNYNVGGGYISQAGEMHLVQGVGLTSTIREIAQTVVKTRQGVPIRLAQLAEVEEGHEIRLGACTANGRGEVVLGLGFMLMGQNSREVTHRLKKRMAEIQKRLPAEVTIQPIYDRTELVDRVIETVTQNLFEGAFLVVAVLFILLGNLRAGLIVALAIPLSMLFASHLMLRVGIAGSLMSLGAIDFGLIVDSSVIMVENSVRQIAEKQDQRSLLEIVRDASLEVRRPTMFGELIILIVYLPILTLEGIEGKLFRPMALTVIFALLGSLVFSLTLMPVLASLLLAKKIKHRENFLIRFAQYMYRPLVRLAIRRRLMVLMLVVALLGFGLRVALRLGTEFVPRLSEMAIVINTVRLAGVSLEESVRYGTQIEKWIQQKYPDEVRDVWVRTGTAEVATDPMGIELSDVFITLHDREKWKRARTQGELVEQMRGELSALPGMRLVFTQPIEMRVQEMIAGVRSDLGIKIFGEDLEILKNKASEVETILRSISGSADITSEQLTGQPMVEIWVNQEAIARQGISTAHILEIVEAIGGKTVGTIREGQKRFALVVRLSDRYRQDLDSVRQITIPTAAGERLPLSSLAQIRESQGPSTITREWQKRRIVVQCNVRGRDLGGFVAEVQREITRRLQLPADYYVTYGGQFEHLQRAQHRLFFVVPLALGMILFLLYTSTRSLRDALIIFSGVPLASVGGIFALAWRQMPFSISAAVGFIAVSGVAMLAGLVLVSTIKQLQDNGLSLSKAIEESALRRLRPILMTTLVASLGFVPMALNTGVGAEVQRPLAIVVIAGVLSANFLTLLVLPSLYALGRKDR